ncbi:MULTISPECIES: hypothetical protein [Rhizobium]|uniref:hypothetical protein n=1 Tax=Rhizobium TaxID=379 RepID=UPI0018D4FA08|nr:MULTISPECIES: hypothetical protein [Rhizobium]WSH48675.1 hypothetical protein U8P77_35810 [Rhizobium johnstonii]
MSTKPSIAYAQKLAFGIAKLLLAGCQNSALHGPLPYSPDYHVAGDPHLAARNRFAKGTDNRLVPDACVTPDVAEDPLYLPPGCANNMNLQLMVRRESDLVQGRETGPAMAAPVVRAARRSIDGTTPVATKSAGGYVGTTDMTD